MTVAEEEDPAVVEVGRKRRRTRIREGEEKVGEGSEVSVELEDRGRQWRLRKKKAPRQWTVDSGQ